MWHPGFFIHIPLRSLCPLRLMHLSGVEPGELLGDDVVVKPQHWAMGLGDLMEHQRAGAFEYQGAQVIGDQCLALLVQPGDRLGGANHYLGQLGGVVHRPGLIVTELGDGWIVVVIGDGFEQGFQTGALLQQRLTVLPLLFGPGTTALFLQCHQQREQREFYADEDVAGVGTDLGTVEHRVSDGCPLPPQFHSR